MLSLKVNVSPSIRLTQKNLELQGTVLSDLKEFFRTKAQPAVKKTFQEIFAMEGAYEGNSRWKELNKKYARQKARQVGSKPILQYSGKYWKALCRSGAAGNIFVNEKNHMEWGIDEGYFSALTGNPSFNYPTIHEKGIGRMPSRPVISLAQNSRRLEADLTKALDKYIKAKIRKYWKIRGMRGMI